MGKIINIDFEKGIKQFTWDDRKEERIELTHTVHKDMLSLLQKIDNLTYDDNEYQDYIARVFKGIVINLKERIQ